MSKSLSQLEVPKRHETKTIGGITFDDPYAWLEKETQEVLAWQAEQDRLAKDTVRSWPGFQRLLTLIQEEDGTDADEILSGVPRLIGGKWFQIAPTKDGTGAAVCVSDRPEEQGRVIIDTLTLAKHLKDKGPVMLWYFEPSPDGSTIALMTNYGGNEIGLIQFVDSKTGKLYPDQVSFPVNNGPVWDWTQDGQFLLAGDRAEDGQHRILFIPSPNSKNPSNEVLFDFDQVQTSIPVLTPLVSPGSRWVLTISGPHEKTALMIGDLKRDTWRPFLPFGFEGECYGAWADEGHFIAVETSTAPRGRVVSIPVDTSTDLATWEELIPETDAVLRSLTVLQDNILLADLLDVSMRLRRFTLTGDYLDQAPLPPYGSSPLVYMFREFAPSDACLFKHETFTQKPTLYQFDLKSGNLKVIGNPGKKLDGIVVSQHFAISLDSTRVPYFIVHHEDLNLSQANPTLITAYGGFNQAWLPSYLAHLVPFIDAGGVFVLGCLRGGGEYGKEWHEAGRLSNKQNTFDDLYAVAEDLIKNRISDPSQLAFQGLSNGGLLAGAAIVQRPDLWKAVVPGVPMFDMMTPAPTAAIRAYTEADYGNSDNPDDAEVIFRYSPYHNIRDGLAYPAVFQFFGEKDESSAPFHGRKFTARLNEANAGDNPILLRVWSDTGHAGLGPTGVMQIAEWLSFVMSQLGLDI